MTKHENRRFTSGELSGLFYASAECPLKISMYA